MAPILEVDLQPIDLGVIVKILGGLRSRDEDARQTVDGADGCDEAIASDSRQLCGCSRFSPTDEREGKEHDRKVIDLMLAHVPTGKVEGAYNRAAYMPRRREIAELWASMLCDGLPEPAVLFERPARETSRYPRRRPPLPVEKDFGFPIRLSLANS